MPSLCLHAVESELVGAMLDAHVRFVIVGGFAVRAHGHLRPAKDLDLMIEPSLENVARLATVLEGFGISFDPNKLAKPKVQAPLKGQLSGIEILTSISEVSFQEAFESSIQWFEHGRAIPVLSKDLLIKSKLARGEDQDMEDVRILRGINEASCCYARTCID
jgi:hypothetical protein